jgi:hypothetical protein
VHRLLILLLVSSCETLLAHEWSMPHHDEELTVDEARALGFDIRVAPITWYTSRSTDSPADNAISAVSITIDFPIVVTGHRLEEGVVDVECDALYRMLDAPVSAGVYTRLLIDSVVPLECAGRWLMWAIYKSPGELGSSSTYLVFRVKGEG